MDHVIGINRRSTFTLEEARALLPVVFKITKTYRAKVTTLVERLDALPNTHEELISSLETQVNDLVQEWQSKVQKLGALPKGLWIADFDAGDGYFCWKFPENSIEFWHSYTDGYSKRISVTERVNTVPFRMPRIATSLRPTELSE